MLQNEDILDIEKHNVICLLTLVDMNFHDYFCIQQSFLLLSDFGY